MYMDVMMLPKSLSRLSYFSLYEIGPRYNLNRLFSDQILVDI